MSLWNNRGFSENDLSPFARWLVGLVVGGAVVMGTVTAVRSVAQGQAPRTTGELMVGAGIVLVTGSLFRLAQRHRTGGSQGMTTGQANALRGGCYLALVGFLLAYW